MLTVRDIHVSYGGIRALKGVSLPNPRSAFCQISKVYGRSILPGEP